MVKLDLEKMKDILKSKNYNYNDLAEKTGISYSTIAKILSGDNKNPTISYIQKIAVALECGVDDFFNWGGAEPTSPYYLDRKTAELAQALKDNPDLRAVLKAARDLPPDDIKFVTDFIEKIKKN